MVLNNLTRRFELLQWDLADVGKDENIPILVTHLVFVLVDSKGG